MTFGLAGCVCIILDPAMPIIWSLVPTSQAYRTQLGTEERRQETATTFLYLLALEAFESGFSGPHFPEVPFRKVETALQPHASTSLSIEIPTPKGAPNILFTSACVTQRVVTAQR